MIGADERFGGTPDRRQIKLVAQRKACGQTSGDRMIGIEHHRIVPHVVTIARVEMRLAIRFARVIEEAPAEHLRPFGPVGPARDRMVHRDCAAAACEMIGDRAAVGEGRRPRRGPAALEAVTRHVIEEDRIGRMGCALGDGGFGFGMDQMGDRPAAEAREQVGEGLGFIGVTAREDEKVAFLCHRIFPHAIFRIILP